MAEAGPLPSLLLLAGGGIMKARAVLLKGPGQIELTDRELELKDDEVLVKTEWASICGTDKLCIQATFLPSTLPWTCMGREIPSIATGKSPTSPFGWVMRVEAQWWKLGQGSGNSNPETG